MGQQALLHAGHYHHRELKALGLVQGDEGQGVFGLLVGVDIGDQRHPFQERAQAVGRSAARGAVIFGQAAKLQDVLPAFVAVVLRVDMLGQTRHIQGSVQQVGDAQLAGGFGEPVQCDGKVRHGAGGPGGDVNGTRQFFGSGRSDFPHRLAAGQSPLGRKGGELLDRLGAQAPGRLVDHALKADLVVRIEDDAQVADGVLDLLAVVEAHAADQPVGNSLPHALVLEGAALRVDAVHDGAVAVAEPSGAGEPRYLVHGPERLVLLAERLVEGNGVSGRIAGVQFPFDPLGVVGDDAVRRPQDVLGGAIVFAQADNRGAGKIALEAEDVADVGVAPGVDALVRVADHAQVLVGSGQQLGQAILGDVGVLELVYKEVAVAPVILFLDL